MPVSTILSVLMATIKSPVSLVGVAVCSLYGERDFNRYICDSMTPLEIERLEAHSENCDDCLRTLHRCHVAREKEKDSEFVSRSMALVDKIDK